MSLQTYLQREMIKRLKELFHDIITYSCPPDIRDIEYCPPDTTCIECWNRFIPSDKEGDDT